MSMFRFRTTPEQFRRVNKMSEELETKPVEVIAPIIAPVTAPKVLEPKKLFGIDISEAQGHINWAELGSSASKPAFIYAKATEGRTIQDAKFREYHDGAKSVGIPFGPYHFFHMGSSTPEEQSKNFLSVIEGNLGQLVPMVDVEGASQDGVTDVGVLVHRLSQFLQIIEATLKGKLCTIYTGYSFWGDIMKSTDAFSGHLFHIAEYANQENPDMPQGVKRIGLWQNTDHKHVIGTSAPVDGDILEVPLDLIKRV